MAHDESNPRATNPPEVPRVSLRLVVVPTEHGGWSFLAEPILLGLLVAFSWSGALIALGALAGFLARQPLKLFASDHQRGKIYPRTRVAERAFAVLALVGTLAMAGAGMLAGWRWAWALAAAVPLAALALWFDLGKRSRDAGAEISGALALGAVATAIALAGGLGAPRAFALWGVLAARAVPTILYVRARLRLEKGQEAGITGALAAHAIAIGGVALLVMRQLSPGTVLFAMALLLARAAWGLSPERPRLKTWQLGVVEIACGIVVVGCAAWG